MDCLRAITQYEDSLCYWFVFFAVLLSSFQDVVAVQTTVGPSPLIPIAVLASSPSSGLFDPIEISPSVIPHYPIPAEPLSPMYPPFPTPYEPILTGKCPLNFSAISKIMEKTAIDCGPPLGPVLGNVICCPQVNSLLHIAQGHHSMKLDELVFPMGVANECFADIISILSSRGAENSTIHSLCSINSLNLTGGSCPVMDATTFEKMVNTSKLLDACSSIDPLKECCRPICQPAITEAALRISSAGSTIFANADVVEESNGINTLNDCKRVVYSWLSRKLSSDAANTAFRILSACKINKACPLEFRQPSEVIKACGGSAAPNSSCCGKLNSYIAGMQKQMLVTNRQAIHCATFFGSILQKGGIMTDIYHLCDVDLKDFTVQGCLLSSLPTDVVYDNSTGFGFTSACDLSGNIAAPWPSSSSLGSLSLCAHEMSLPALLPTSEAYARPGVCSRGFGFLIPIFWFFLSSVLSLREVS